MFLYESYRDFLGAWNRSTHHGSLGQRFEVQRRLGDHIPKQSDHHPAQLLIPHLDIEVNLDDSRESDLIHVACNRYTKFAVTFQSIMKVFTKLWNRIQKNQLKCLLYITVFFSKLLLRISNQKRDTKIYPNHNMHIMQRNMGVSCNRYMYMSCNCGHSPYLLYSKISSQ